MKKVKRVLALAVAVVMTAVMAISPVTAVSASAAPSKYVKSLKVSKSKVTLEAGKKATVNATVKVKGSASKKVTVKLTKANKKVVESVKVGKPNKKGVSKLTITAANVSKKSTTTIKVVTKAKNSKNKTITKKIKVTVNPKAAAPAPQPQPQPQPQPVVPQVTAVSVSAPITSIEIGSSTQAVATVTPSNAQTTITWTSSNPEVAAVDSVGKVVGINAGTSTITAKAANGVSGSINITVTAVKVTGVSLDKETVEMTVGSTSVLKETVTPATATDKRVSWTSSDPTVVRVDATGAITAVKAGTARISVETVDGGFKDWADVTVKDDSKNDVDKVSVCVSNDLDGRENTVLVGTQAKIDIAVTKDGAPYGNDSVNVVIDPTKSTGYFRYYELSSEDAMTTVDGTTSVYLRLKSDYREYMKPLIDENRNNLAYANIGLTVTSGGANITEKIQVSFAQVLPETFNTYEDWNNGGKALSVENVNDPLIKKLEGTDSYFEYMDTITKEEYVQQYVVDQQVTNVDVPNGDHEVVLDAAPLLVSAAAIGTENKDVYEKDNINFTCSEYSVYAGEEDAYVLEDVPGGLEYLTLTFDGLKLSKHTRIIVRAYQKDTNYPIVDLDEKLIQDEINSITEVTETGSGSTVQIRKAIFNETTENIAAMDLKIFVESAGQVSEDDNVGFTLKKARGPWKNQTVVPSVVERLPGAVSWDTVAVNGYTGETILKDAAAYLGEYYNSNNTYKVTMPAFPDTGNAIIYTYDANGTRLSNCYMYPTVAVDNENVLYGKNSAYVFKAASDQASRLVDGTFTAVVGEDGRYTIDSPRAGYVPVKASINVFDTVKYDVYSYVQWSKIPDRVIEASEDFYALTSQTVTLTATVKDVAGNIGQEQTVKFINVPKEKITNNNEYSITDDGVVVVRSNSDGKAVLELTSAEPIMLKEIKVDAGEKYKVSLNVKDQAVAATSVNIHWVKPGIYYKDDVAIDGREYDTANEVTTKKTETANYLAGNTWIIGTLVSGYTPDVDVVNISNIKLAMSTSSTTGLSVNLVEKSNGVCTVASEKIGESATTTKIVGFMDAAKECIISVNQGGTIVDYVSVGEGDFTHGADLLIPIKWSPNGAQISFINNYTKYDLKNGNEPKVYVSVVDKYNNPVVNSEVTYRVEHNQEVLVEATAQTSDKGLVEIEIPFATEAATYNVSAMLTNLATSVTTSVEFTNNNYVNNIVADGISKDIDNKQISVIFNSEVNAKNLAFIDKFINIYDNGNKIDVDSVVIDPANSQKIIITTKQEISSAVEVEFDSAVEENEIEYYFIDANGAIYQP